MNVRQVVLFLLGLGLIVPVGACVRDPVRDGQSPQPPTEPSLPPVAIAGFASPVRAVGTAAGRLLVTDAQQRLVAGVDPLTLRPDRALRLDYRPSAVGLLGRRVYVGNPERGTIEMYAAEGGARAGSFGPGAAGYAMDVAADETRGLIFVVDGASPAVRVFTADGAPLSVLGDAGAGQLVTPVGVALDTIRQEVLVSDYGAPATIAASIRIYGYDGRYLDQISGAGTCGMVACSGGFSRPQGLAISRLGHVFVADALLGQVLVYDRATKALLQSLGGYPALHLPSDVVIGENDDLYVVSNLTASVVVFAGAGAR